MVENKISYEIISIKGKKEEKHKKTYPAEQAPPPITPPLPLISVPLPGHNS